MQFPNFPKKQPDCRVNVPALGGWVSAEKAAEYFAKNGQAPQEPAVQVNENDIQEVEN